MIYIFFLLFILGTCLGSFISCIAYRYKLGISIIYPRSFCENCSQNLQYWQLIPVIGFILQKGKCHFCKQKIPLSSTVIELAIGVIFIFNTIIIANTNLIFTSLLVVWLTLISLEDYYTLSVDSITLEYGGLILLIFRFHTVITNLKANFLIIIIFTNPNPFLNFDTIHCYIYHSILLLSGIYITKNYKAKFSLKNIFILLIQIMIAFVVNSLINKSNYIFLNSFLHPNIKYNMNIEAFNIPLFNYSINEVLINLINNLGYFYYTILLLLVITVFSTFWLYIFRKKT